MLGIHFRGCLGFSWDKSSAPLVVGILKPYLAGYFLQDLAAAQTTWQIHGQRARGRKNKVGYCWTPERHRERATRGQRERGTGEKVKVAARCEHENVNKTRERDKTEERWNKGRTNRERHNKERRRWRTQTELQIREAKSPNYLSAPRANSLLNISCFVKSDSSPSFNCTDFKLMNTTCSWVHGPSSGLIFGIIKPPECLCTSTFSAQSVGKFRSFYQREKKNFSHQQAKREQI